MMNANYISTYMLSATLRYSITNNESALSKASKEATTSRFADVGLQLGSGAGRDVSLRADMDFISKIVDTNGLVSSRLDVTQNRITQLISTAQDFLKSLIAARDVPNGAQMILPTAAANQQDLIGVLNSSYNGAYLFGGINTQNAPLTNYVTSVPMSTNAQQVFNDFTAAFGMPQSSPSASTITPAAMQSFLNTTFDAEFQNPAWGTNWSSATNQTLSSRISTTQIVNTSVSANQQGFRQLAEAYTMLSDLGTANLSQTTFQTVVNKAITLVGSAVDSLAVLGGTVGSVQQQVSTATDKLNIQHDILYQQIVDMEKVDPAEASVRVNTLQNQIETALSLTARMQKISLINYL
jgi:flagellar hook-associated protein 3 FlgL